MNRDRDKRLSTTEGLPAELRRGSSVAQQDANSPSPASISKGASSSTTASPRIFQDAFTPEEALREATQFEWTHDCHGCGEEINTRFRYCKVCSRYSERKAEYLARVNEGKRKKEDQESYACGCTEQRWRPAGAKHWQEPSPDCVVCGGKIDHTGEVFGSGRLRDRHSHLKLARRMGAAPDISVEAGSFEEGELLAGYEESENAVTLADGTRFDFLVEGGWHITGPEPSSGLPVGRRVKGITARAEIYQELVTQAGNGKFRAILWTDPRDALCVLIALASELNIAATANALGFHRDTIYEYRKRGRMLLSKLDEIIEKIDRLDDRLAMDYPLPEETAMRILAEEAEKADEKKWLK
jgi:hypothetical protein